LTHFSREFPIDLLTKAVLQETLWFTELLRRWHPAGDAARTCLDDTKDALARDQVSNEDKFQNLRVAFRGGYMNFYCGGQSIAEVSFGRNGLQAKIHVKYVYGSNGSGQDYVTLTSKGFPEQGTGRLVAYESMEEWISNANDKIGTEKRFVDLVVAHNPNVIDLEMGLPANSEIPGERSAPRIDLMALEACESGWRIVSWEAKLVGDGRARCSGEKLPEIVGQLSNYTTWLSASNHEEIVANAYQENCSLLVKLHAIAKLIRPDIEELGKGIQAVAASNAPLPAVDKKPRLLIIYDKNDTSFRENGHDDKLKRADWGPKIVKTLSYLPLCKQS